MWCWSSQSLNLPNAFSQAVYGTIFGTVTDPDGRRDTERHHHRDGYQQERFSHGNIPTRSGDYQSEHLIPDVYRVEATAQPVSTRELWNSVEVFADTQPKVEHPTSGWSCEQYRSCHFGGAIAEHGPRRREYDSELAGAWRICPT